ncbi:MAG: hypothetical protein KI790_10080, partial [Cyclobacteriaceae bacterium]|nr:hypothetical protein [Cyclobacteriaceae bacterium HetDA_MAG_MS6]
MRLFLILFGVSIFISAPAQSLREIYSQGTKAYEAKNFTAFQKAMFRFDSLRPNYPVVVYNLAAAYALTGESDEAIATLKRYILMNNATKFWEDEDFSTLRDSDSFQKLQEWAILLSKPIDLTTVAMSVDLQKQHPEGITYSRKSDAFFVGMVRSGRISKTSSEMVQFWQE